MGEVRVYFNLHRRLFSVQAKTERGWRVATHAPAVVLDNVTFQVSAAGRQRVLAEGRKNVHAYVRGLIAPTADVSVEGGRRLTYNPYRHSGFTYADMASAENPPILASATRVVLTVGPDGRPNVYALGLAS